MAEGALFQELGADRAGGREALPDDRWPLAVRLVVLALAVSLSWCFVFALVRIF